MLTLSLANWMELPGLKLKDWMRDKRRYEKRKRNIFNQCIEQWEHCFMQHS